MCQVFAVLVSKIVHSLAKSNQLSNMTKLPQRVQVHLDYYVSNNCSIDFAFV